MLYAHFNDKGRLYKTDLDEQERLNRDKYIPCIALKRYTYSSFRYLFLSGNDQALVNVTGHDNVSFSRLLHKYNLTHDTYLLDLETRLIRKK